MSIGATDASQRGAQSVDRALALLSRIGRHPETGLSLSDLTAASGLNKPTVRRLLLALMRGGLIEQDDTTRAYRLGEESYVLGTLAAARHGLVETASDVVEKLARDSGDTAFVTIRRGMSAVCLHRQEGSFPIRTHALIPGAQHPLGVGAGSLAMLAALPDAEVETVMTANAPLLLDQYPSLHPGLLRRQIAETRERGYAVNPGLVVAGSWGIGVAVRRGDGSVAGALSLAAIESRLQPPRDRALADTLIREARTVEARLARSFTEHAEPRTGDAHG